MTAGAKLFAMLLGNAFDKKEVCGSKSFKQAQSLFGQEAAILKPHIPNHP